MPIRESKGEEPGARYVKVKVIGISWIHGSLYLIKAKYRFYLKTDYPVNDCIT